MKPIILHEETGHTSSPLAKDSLLTVDAGRAAGWDVFTFSSDFDLFGDAEEALENLRGGGARDDAGAQTEIPGIWIGFIPNGDRYRAIYEAAQKHGVVLLNNPAEYLLATEFDRFYPHLAQAPSLTPESGFISATDECHDLIEKLGLPLFVKGVVRSARTQGYKACVAESEDELRDLVTRLLAMEARSRGRIVARKLVKLRHARVAENGFPLGREYRVITYAGQVMGHGYYWEGDDPLMALSAEEERAVLTLAKEAATRVNAPLMTVDVGQLESGEWTVIETGDPQFAGWSQIDRQATFKALMSAVQ